MSRSRSAAAACAVALVVCAPAAAQREPIAPLDLAPADLTFPVQSLDRSVTRATNDDELRLSLAADVLFAFDSARLSPRADRRLREAAAAVRGAEIEPVRVVGHTDARGSGPYNQRLSLRRAEAVARRLRALLGGDAPQLAVQGRGERDPVAANVKEDGTDAPRGRALNRRVEIRIPRGG